MFHCGILRVLCVQCVVVLSSAVELDRFGLA